MQKTIAILYGTAFITADKIYAVSPAVPVKQLTGTAIQMAASVLIQSVLV